jgi:hypothetical protein
MRNSLFYGAAAVALVLAVPAAAADGVDAQMLANSATSAVMPPHGATSAGFSAMKSRPSSGAKAQSISSVSVDMRAMNATARIESGLSTQDVTQHAMMAPQGMPAKAPGLPAKAETESNAAVAVQVQGLRASPAVSSAAMMPPAK